MTMKSTEPFAATLTKLMEDRGWSARELARQTERLGDKSGHLSYATTSALQRGAALPGLRSMRLIAKAMNTDPAVFAEYRLDAQREALDHRHRPLSEALKALGE